MDAALDRFDAPTTRLASRLPFRPPTEESSKLKKTKSELEMELEDREDEEKGDDEMDELKHSRSKLKLLAQKDPKSRRVR